MKSFVSEHPWMTFFLAWAAIDVVGAIAVAAIKRGQPTTATASLAKPPSALAGYAPAGLRIPKEILDRLSARGVG